MYVVIALTLHLSVAVLHVAGHFLRFIFPLARLGRQWYQQTVYQSGLDRGRPFEADAAVVADALQYPRHADTGMNIVLRVIVTDACIEIGHDKVSIRPISRHRTFPCHVVLVGRCLFQVLQRLVPVRQGFRQADVPPRQGDVQRAGTGHQHRLPVRDNLDAMTEVPGLVILTRIVRVAGREVGVLDDALVPHRLGQLDGVRVVADYLAQVGEEVALDVQGYLGVLVQVYQFPVYE